MTTACAGGAVLFAVVSTQGWAGVIAGRPETLPTSVEYDLHVGGAVLTSVLTHVMVGFTALCTGLTASLVKSRRRHQS